VVSTAAEIRSRNRREVTLPSGNVYVIRKLTQLDYVPKGLVGLAAETVEDKDKLRAHLMANYDDVIELEDNLIMRAVVQPVISRTPVDGDQLWIGDLGDDRQALLDAINDWSGTKGPKETP